MQKRAKAGGEIGMNGETYAGGTFLPRTQLSKMAKAARSSGQRKVEIEPFKWAEARDGFRPIFPQFPYKPEAHPEMRNRGTGYAHLDTLYAAWMQGERWVAA
jgi:hypothetical protein